MSLAEILGPVAGGMFGLLAGYLLSYCLAQRAPSPTELVAILSAIASGAIGDHMLGLGNPQISMALYMIALVPGFILYRLLLQLNLPRLHQAQADSPPPVAPWIGGRDSGPSKPSRS